MCRQDDGEIENTEQHSIWSMKTAQVIWLCTLAALLPSASLALPDYQMGSVTFSPSQVGVGGEVTVNCSFASVNGDSNYYAAGIYLSTDTTITTNDIYLGNIALYCGNKPSDNFTDVLQTKTTAPGQYYVGVILDYKNQLPEANENNNVGVSSSRLTIAAEKPDLTVLSVESTSGTSFVVGDTVYVHARIKNLATNVPAPSSTIYFVLSPDTTITATDTYATHLTPSSLEAQETRDLYDSFIVTTSMVGQYYLGAFIDPGNNIDESNEGNNAACGQRLTIQSAPLTPDFAVVQILITPSSPVQGSSFNATVTVTNQGSGAGDGGYLNVWINQPDSVSPGDGTWNQTWRIGTLSVGQSKAFTFTDLTAPSALGTYTFRAFIDGPGKTTESNEANNEQELSYQVAPLSVPRIILDTDLASDCDDLGAVAVLHALANQGKAEILGMVCNVSDPNSPLCLSAINTYYGRPNIPIGYLNTTVVNPTPWPLPYYNKYTDSIANDHTHIPPDQVQDAVGLYRNILEANGGVTIVSIGSFYNLEQLLRIHPSLVRQKVLQLVVMGGSYPPNPPPAYGDYNFSLAGTSAAYVISNWPTRIVFSDLGKDVITGHCLFTNTNVAVDNPIREGYDLGTRLSRVDGLDCPSTQSRPSWDPIAVLYAVCGTNNYFSLEGPGTNQIVFGLPPPLYATNSWSDDITGNHFYIRQTVPNSVLAEVIGALMTQAPIPRAPSNLSAIAISTNEIDLTWQRNANNEDGYEIERSTDGIDFDLIAFTMGAIRNNFTDNAGLSPCTTYNYRVRAYNTSGDSDFSNIANATTGCGYTFTINTSSSPSEGGTNSGGGTVNSGSSVTVTATPSSGCSFVNWTEGGNIVSTSTSYTFTAVSDRNLVANFFAVTCTTSNGTITITKYNGSGGPVTIPAMINGLPVTSIGNNAFRSCTSLTSVTISNSVTSIGIFAFESCISLTSVTIPNTVTNIGNHAFGNCSSLTSITIPNSVTSIANWAFGNCTSLTSVTIPNTVTNIGNNAFGNCTSLTSVTIPNSVTSIGISAFQACTGLTGITIPNSVISIGSSAFSSCSSLNNVTIPNSVTNVGNSAFSRCTSLVAITVDSLNSFYSSVAGVLFNKSQTTLMQYPAGKAGSYKVPNSVTSIGSYAFDSCTSLTSVTIPNTVTNIGNNAFGNCTSLTSVYFKGNAPSVGSSVFSGDNNATVYYLPGTTGWENFAQLTGRPTVLWNPQAQTSDGIFGVLTNQFGFNITDTNGLVIVVEACTNLADPAWSPVGTNTLTGGSSYFSDPRWTNYPARFYRLRSP
jgi:inosine-uridine nucleoside N-ribohydrolase